MENADDRRTPWLWRCRRPVLFPVQRHFRGRRTLSLSEGESKSLPSGQDHRRGVAKLLQRCRLRGQARRGPRQHWHPPFDEHEHRPEPRQAVPGIRTLGAFGTRRPFPSRTCTGAVRRRARVALPVSEGSTIIHELVASRTAATPSPVRPGQRRRTARFRAGRPSHPCEWPEQAPRAPGGAESRPRPLRALFHPAIMERWIV